MIVDQREAKYQSEEVEEIVISSKDDKYLQ